MVMESINGFPEGLKGSISYLLTDIDDTITNEGRIPACAFAALEALQRSGIKVVPITGRPAGWCDHIARMWPVDGVVGENGAFYYQYDDRARKMTRRYARTRDQRLADRKALDAIALEILDRVPGCRISADQAFREADLAIDFCEDVPRISDSDIDAIVSVFEARGATAKISSIHVNGWFGSYDKLSMTRLFFAEVFGKDLDAVRDRVVFSGDSPNDEPMFAFFPNSVGVANIRAFEAGLIHKPRWVTDLEGGFGFSQLAALLS